MPYNPINVGCGCGVAGTEINPNTHSNPLLCDFNSRPEPFKGSAESNMLSRTFDTTQNPSGITLQAIALCPKRDLDHCPMAGTSTHTVG